ncbi:unnamed protein product, partial [Amoebophrya sp. A25]
VVRLCVTESTQRSRDTQCMRRISLSWISVVRLTCSLSDVLVRPQTALMAVKCLRRAKRKLLRLCDCTRLNPSTTTDWCNSSYSLSQHLSSFHYQLFSRDTTELRILKLISPKSIVSRISD